MTEIELMKAYQSSDTGIPVDIAGAYAALGDRDQAFAWLEKATSADSPASPSFT